MMKTTKERSRHAPVLRRPSIDDFHEKSPSIKPRSRPDIYYKIENDNNAMLRVEPTPIGRIILVKYFIYGFNIVFLMFGLSLLTLGVWLRTDSRFREFLSERYRQAVHEAFWQAPTLYYFSYILIVIGCCLILFNFVGCCGAIRENRCLLGTYFVCVFFLFVACLSSGIYLAYKRDGIDNELADALNYMVQHYYQGPGVVQEALDNLQQTFRCCGNSGCSDFRDYRMDIPRSCDLRCDGCRYRIWNALSTGFIIAICLMLLVVTLQVVVHAATLCFIIVCLQLFAMAASLYLFCISRSSIDQYMDSYRNPAIPPKRPQQQQQQCQQNDTYAVYDVHGELTSTKPRQHVHDHHRRHLPTYAAGRYLLQN